MQILLLAFTCCNFLLVLAVGYLSYEKTKREIHSVNQEKKQDIDKIKNELSELKVNVEDNKVKLYDSLFNTYDMLQQEMRNKIERG